MGCWFPLVVVMLVGCFETVGCWDLVTVWCETSQTRFGEVCVCLCPDIFVGTVVAIFRLLEIKNLVLCSEITVGVTFRP